MALYRLLLINFIFLAAANYALAKKSYKTEPIDVGIRTIQVIKNGNWLENPIINLNSSDYVDISFDRLSKEDIGQLRYKIIHCNADWTESSLASVEFLDGFNDNIVYDYAESTNTTVEYTNFKLQIPNTDVKLKKSGNYVVVFYEEENPTEMLLSACFSILDEQVSIAGKFSTNTDIDSNLAHQQISFEINTGGIRLQDPVLDLKVYVTQNNRLDNKRKIDKPTHIQNNKLIYQYNRDLIFEAGNEYRRFEIVSHQYNGLNVDYQRYSNPFYQAYLVPVRINAGRFYSYDEDHNGRFYIRNADANDSDIEGDYFFVNFILKADYPFDNNVYINGNFTYNRFTEDFLMQYDYTEKVYFASLLLKQGAYNYQFLTQNKENYSPAETEGNYFQTENEYLIWVYHRPMGQQYDSLVGLLPIRMNN